RGGLRRRHFGAQGAELVRRSETSTLAAGTKRAPRCEAVPSGCPDLNRGPLRPAEAPLAAPTFTGARAELVRPAETSNLAARTKRAPRCEALPSGGPDLNWGPLRPERSAIPGCAPPPQRPTA